MTVTDFTVDLSNSEITRYSDSGEDGIIEKLFELYGVTNKYYVEFGAEWGNCQNNTYSLRKHYGFNGLLMDSSYENESINLHKHFVTEENVLELFMKYNVPKEYDLLSLDIDSHDFYVLNKILSTYSPRIIVCEYNATHLPDEDKVVLRNETNFVGNYFGASILAFYNLGRKYKYSLVYSNKKGVNLFFVRDDILSSSKYKIKNVNDVAKIYNTPKYGTGPNGGHFQDPFNREYTSSHTILTNVVQINCYDTNYGRMCCLPNDIVFNSEMRNGKIYEEHLIVKNIIPLFNTLDSLVILDVGSHIGSHSVIYSKLFPNSQILAFEPQSIIFNILNKNIHQNNINNCSVYNNAVGHINMDTTMSKYLYDGYDCKIEYGVDKTLNYGGIGLGKDGEYVKMISIDSLNLERCDYIKIDVEGAEILVLTGALNTINKYHPIIFFEETDKTISTEMIESMNININFETPRELLIKIGYHITNIDNNNCLATYPT